MSDDLPFELQTKGYFLSILILEQFCIPKSYFDIDLIVHVRIFLELIMVIELKLYFCLLFSEVDNFPVEVDFNRLIIFIKKFNVKALKLNTLDIVIFTREVSCATFNNYVRL